MRKGFRIIARNDRERWGELDIVAIAPDRLLVFIEVKTMRPGRLKPEDHLSPGKLRRFAKAAAIYAGRHQTLVRPKLGWRLDAITIVLPYDDTTPAITHYPNVGCSGTL